MLENAIAYPLPQQERKEMTPKELKDEIERREISRLGLAKKIGCTYGYMCQMLNGYTPLKAKWHDRIVAELEKGK
jgi:hypothetical protein